MLRLRRLAVIIFVGCFSGTLAGLASGQVVRPNSQAPATSTPAITGQPANGNANAAGNMTMFDALVNSIDPYLPTARLGDKIQVYGSTAMDNMAHAWAVEFKRFHPEVTVEVSAAGSGDAFGQLKQNPQAVAMLSRPVKKEELDQIKSPTITNPVAFVVAREALGVFVHATNPVKSISGDQMRTIFTKKGPDADLKWKLLGVTGEMAEQPIRIVSRSETSGTQAFLREFVFGGMEMRASEKTHGSNSDVLGALASDPLGITICGLRANVMACAHCR